MERRSSSRKQVEVSVYLSSAFSPRKHCIARDINETGIYLKTGDPRSPLPRKANRPYDLIFALHLKSSNVVRLRRVSAVVTHTQPDGVGMTFCTAKSNAHHL